MILLTGASGTVGRALLPLLLEAGHDVRALVRDPRGLGRHRVDVQIALGDLARLGDRHLQRQALRGVDTVIHLAAAIRDEPHARVEELNGLATARLLRAAERAGSSASSSSRRWGRPSSSGPASSAPRRSPSEAVDASPLATTVFAPSIVYDPGDRWVRLMKRLALLPVLPISGSGRVRLPADLGGRRGALRDRVARARASRAPATSSPGPEVLTYDQIARTVARAAGASGRWYTCRSASST